MNKKQKEFIKQGFSSIYLVTTLITLFVFPPIGIIMCAGFVAYEYRKLGKTQP